MKNKCPLYSFLTNVTKNAETTKALITKFRLLAKDTPLRIVLKMSQPWIGHCCVATTTNELVGELYFYSETYICEATRSRSIVFPSTTTGNFLLQLVRKAHVSCFSLLFLSWKIIVFTDLRKSRLCLKLNSRLQLRSWQLTLLKLRSGAWPT